MSERSKRFNRAVAVAKVTALGSLPLVGTAQAELTTRTGSERSLIRAERTIGRIALAVSHLPGNSHRTTFSSKDRTATLIYNKSKSTNSGAESNTYNFIVTTGVKNHKPNFKDPRRVTISAETASLGSEPRVDFKLTYRKGPHSNWGVTYDYESDPGANSPSNAEHLVGSIEPSGSRPLLHENQLYQLYRQSFAAIGGAARSLPVEGIIQPPPPLSPH